MKNKLIVCLVLLGFKNCLALTTAPESIYEQHKFFTCSLAPNSLNFKEIHNYLPTNLSEQDQQKVKNFILNYRGQEEVNLVFYKDGDVTHLKAITTNKENSTNDPNSRINYNYFVEQQVSAQSPAIRRNSQFLNIKKFAKNSSGNNFVIKCKEKNLKVNLITNIGSISDIKEILAVWETIKLHYATRLDIDAKEISEKIIQLIFHKSLSATQLIGIKVIDKVHYKKNNICDKEASSLDSREKSNISLRKKCFYIMYVGSRKLVIDEQGYVVPGDILHITNTMPIKNAINNLGSKFGYRLHPILRKRKFHSGQDIRAPLGTEIYSMGEGIVVFAGYNRVYGYVVVVYHGNNINEGYSTLYAHCNKLLVKKGMRVKKGQLIGLVGSTGRSTGPHLHFEVINNKTRQRLNPVLMYNLSTRMIPPFLIKDFVKIKQKVEDILAHF